MYKKELEKRDCYLSFKDEDEFAEFLMYMNKKDFWLRDLSCRISFKPLEKGMDPKSLAGPGVFYSTEEVLEDVSRTGGVIMQRSCNTSSSEFGVVNLDVAQLTLDERAGAKKRQRLLSLSLMLSFNFNYINWNGVDAYSLMTQPKSSYLLKLTFLIIL